MNTHADRITAAFNAMAAAVKARHHTITTPDTNPTCTMRLDPDQGKRPDKWLEEIVVGFVHEQGLVFRKEGVSFGSYSLATRNGSVRPTHGIRNVALIRLVNAAGNAFADAYDAYQPPPTPPRPPQPTLSEHLYGDDG